MSNANPTVEYPSIKTWAGQDTIKNLDKRLDSEFFEIQELKKKTYKAPPWVGFMLFSVASFQFSTSLVKNAFSGYLTGSQIAVSKSAILNPFAIAEAANFVIFQLSMLVVSAIVAIFAYKYVPKSAIKWPIFLVAIPALSVSLLANLAWMIAVQTGTDSSPIVELFKFIGGRNYEQVQWTVNIFISFATEFSLFFIPLIAVYLNTPARESRLAKRLANDLKRTEQSKAVMALAISERDTAQSEIQAAAHTAKQSRIREINLKNAKDTLLVERQIISDYLRYNANSGAVKGTFFRVSYFLLGIHNTPKGYIEQVLGSKIKKSQTP